MTFGLDTSVVLRLLTGQPQELAARALALYQEGITLAASSSRLHRHPRAVRLDSRHVPRLHEAR